MDWLDRMNAAIRYIEENLTDDLEFREVAKIACCSVHHFQRVFSYITNVSLSEYIRRRRLTLAAFELQTTNVKVVDLSLKYGYDSPEAFSRAFHALHGVTPSAARKSGVQLRAFPRMTFTITIRGDVGMNYRIEEKPPFSVVGVKQRVSLSDNAISRLWEEANENGFMQQLINILWSTESKGPRGVLGVCANGDHGKNDEFDYYLATVSDNEPSTGMQKLEFPAGTWVVFEVSNPNDTLDTWKRIYTEWFPTSGYELADVPAIECFCPPGHHPAAEIWVAIEKR